MEGDSRGAKWAGGLRWAYDSSVCSSSSLAIAIYSLAACLFDCHRLYPDQTRLLPSTATLPTATPVGDSAPEHASASAAASGVICCCLRSTAPPGWSRRLLRSLREAVPRLPKSRACVGQHEVTPGQHHQRWIRIILNYSLSGLGLRLTDTSSTTAVNTVILDRPDLAFCQPSHSLCPRARCMQAEIIGPGLT